MKKHMRKLIFTLSLVGLFSCQNKAQSNPETLNMSIQQENMEKQNIYQFKVNDINGKEFDFSSLQGKKILVVNTASKCGLTPQYKELQALYEKFGEQGLVIVGFPANNFMGQEPGSNEEIAEFCQANYGVTFPMMEKISVQGKDMHPVYEFLTKKELNGHSDSKVEWNFQKYLISEEGYLVEVFSPRTKPMDDKILKALQ
jgi:glutathione peroxidase